MTYILTNGLSGFSLEILQPGLLIWEVMKSHIWDRGNKARPYLSSLPYYRTIPFVSLCILIGMVYAVVSPLLLPFLVGYFCLGYVVFVNQVGFLSSSTNYMLRLFVEHDRYSQCSVWIGISSVSYALLLRCKDLQMFSINIFLLLGMNVCFPFLSIPPHCQMFPTRIMRRRI